MTDSQPKALKEWFDKPRFERIATDVSAVWAPFDAARFLALGCHGLDQLTLLQRLRRVSVALRETLPAPYPEALAILFKVADRTEKGFVSLFLPDFVGQYGLQDFDLSMQALKRFTPLGSSEFAVREFLRADLPRTLRVMQAWSVDSDEHVRRLASEGSRPRLPWSFKLQPIIDAPDLTWPLLSNLSRDPSLYVRKSVANHLNDVSKDHPEWLLKALATWPRDHPHPVWIAKRALRTLVKQGHPDALLQVGASEKTAVSVVRFEVSPAALTLGERLMLSVDLRSESDAPQQLVVDYRVHYVKKSGATSAKTFKMKELTLASRGLASVQRQQLIKDFTTRTHHGGWHAVALWVNGQCVAQSGFTLQVDRPTVKA